MAFMESMGSSSMPLVAAFFIGLMTAISPCPLATNITAVAYISRRMENSRHTLLVGFLYTLGRAFTYAGLASLIVYIGINTREIASFVQSYGEQLLGPLLLAVGLVMLEVVKLDFLGAGNRLGCLKEALADKGYLGSFLLGVVFALAFCPFSGVLYFGMLIPLALKLKDGFVIPSVFAFATGLPVILTSLLLAKSISKLGVIMNRVQAVEKWVRKAAAVIFILVGAYYTLIFL
ncbi:MAG: aromatic aminobenezylarsenical efflux permease ArsG family transporter [Candidatus Altiarchaeota archaeon]|nr:aromatic aminobenezylarsenical efflux permease ArsG family transporter [Candidatus Altiarchaeota archaeon]